MKIEKLRNNHKKEIIIGTILTVVIGGALTFRLTHSKYRVTQSIDLAEGVINYTVPDFKIMAMYKSEDGTNYTEMSASDRMPGSGYAIDESQSYCNLNGSKDTTAVLKTIDGNHVIANLIKGDKCYLYFKKDTGILATSVSNLITKLGSIAKTTAPNFTQTATTDEGIYKTSDGMYNGTTYYWRGATTNNYVKFAGYCWRIIRINGDGTLRLIYDGSTCHANGTSTAESIAVTSQTYNSSRNQSNYVGWTYTGTSQRTTSGSNSNAKTQTESWYNSNIGNNNTYKAKVATGKFCNNRNAGSGYTWTIKPDSTFYYEEYTNRQNGTPSTSCPSGDVYTLNVGAITASEVNMAGGQYATNKSYYLYNGESYWTMSPYNWDGSYAGVFHVGSFGTLTTDNVGYTTGLRPVINLIASTTFSSGNGTQTNPYVVQ